MAAQEALLAKDPDIEPLRFPPVRWHVTLGLIEQPVDKAADRTEYNDALRDAFLKSKDAVEAAALTENGGPLELSFPRLALAPLGKGVRCTNTLKTSACTHTHTHTHHGRALTRWLVSCIINESFSIGLLTLKPFCTRRHPLQVLVDIGDDARARLMAIAKCLEESLGSLGFRVGSGHQVCHAPAARSLFSFLFDAAHLRLYSLPRVLAKTPFSPT